jgi:phosphate butyryltransferase
MNFATLETKLQSRKTPMTVCRPEDAETVLAAKEASDLGYVDCLFVGNPDVIKPLLEKETPGFSPEIIPAATESEAAFKAVELIRTKKAFCLMKGNISTPVLLKAILDSETGIKKGKILSHVLVFEWEGRLKFLTDGGMLPHPTLAEKEEILRNAVALAHKLGIPTPNVAVLSAVETVNTKMPSTLDAAILAKMGDRKQFGACRVDGPLALDNAISEESAHHKGLYNDVVGKADILIAPDIDTGNVLGKTILYFAQTPSGGLIIGATVPVVMLSRSDTKDVRLNSIKLALAAGL